MIVDLLEEEAVLPGVSVRDADEVLELLGERLQALGAVRPGFVEAVLDREHNMPTGLELAGEHNVAIPHADPHHVVRPCMAVATTAQPVVFHNMGDPDAEVPVRVVFLLALTDPNGHIEVLSRIAGVLESPDAIDRLVDAKGRDELLEAIAAVFDAAGTRSL